MFHVRSNIGQPTVRLEEASVRKSLLRTLNRYGIFSVKKEMINENIRL